MKNTTKIWYVSRKKCKNMTATKLQNGRQETCKKWMKILESKNGLHFSCIFSGSHNIFSTFSSTCLRVKFTNQLRIDAIFLHFLWLQALTVEKNPEKIQISAKKKNSVSGGVRRNKGVDTRHVNFFQKWTTLQITSSG